MKTYKFKQFRYKVSAAYLAMTAMMFGAVSCADNDLAGDSASGNGGGMTEAVLELDTEVPFGEFRTRADAMGNTTVQSLWVGVYDITTGNRVGGSHFSNPSSPLKIPVIYYDEHPTVVIVGVANYTETTDWEGTPLALRLDEATTWNDFVDLNVKMPDAGGKPEADTDRPHIMMGLLSGSDSPRAFYRKSDNGSVSIDRATNYEVNLSPSSMYGSMIKVIEGRKIYLKRLFAMVNVSVTSGNDASVTNVSFRRGNIPLATYLAERPTYTGGVSNWGPFLAGTPNYADTQMTVGGGQVQDAPLYYTDSADEWIAAGNDNTFSFAHFDNKHWGQNPSTDHADREALSENKRYLYRLGHEYNGYASYFVVRMTILDKRRNRSAQVEYIIHEGNINDEYGDALTSNERGRDYAAFRNTVYNYNINVNGIDYITYNVENSQQHHDAASGVIWEADISAVNYNWYTGYTGDITVSSNSNLLFRFYVGRGPDSKPYDYIDGTLPENINGMFWPLIDDNTNSGNMLANVSGSFRFTKERKNLTLQEFINDARSNGGTYTVTFTPSATAAQWYPDAYRIGIYFYNPAETTSLSGIDDDECTYYTRQKVHVIEWMPSQKRAVTLSSLSSYNLPSPNIVNFVTQYVDINLNTAHNASGNGSSGTYGIDYVYHVLVNGNDYIVGNNLICQIPTSVLNSYSTSYSVYAEALNTKELNSSGTTSSTITGSDPSWDFTGNEFSNWFNSNFPANNNGRHDSSGAESKTWKNGLSINISASSTIGGPANDGALYFNNSGSSRNISFTIYSDCKMDIKAFANGGEGTLCVRCTGSDELKYPLPVEGKTYTEIPLKAADGGSVVTIYQGTGSVKSYFHLINLKN